ncbi:hypothetical protein CHX26_12375 [Porphyrobacter sp. HT-58-2]|nr:hypothetical protein CHX26_12375 [Porphyrobacter sp. HT-58-2]
MSKGEGMRAFQYGFVALAMVTMTASAIAAADPAPKRLSHEQAISCAALGVLHSSMTGKGYDFGGSIDYTPRAKIWLQHAIDSRPSDWQEQRVVDEFKALNVRTSEFISGLFARYQQEKTEENLQAIVSAVKAMKQDLADCDAHSLGQ